MRLLSCKKRINIKLIEVVVQGSVQAGEISENVAVGAGEGHLGQSGSAEALVEGAVKE